MTTWLFKVDMTEGQGRCIKRSVLIARKSAKFPSSPAEIVQFTAGIAFQSARKKVVNFGVSDGKIVYIFAIRRLGSVPWDVLRTVSTLSIWGIRIC